VFCYELRVLSNSQPATRNPQPVGLQLIVKFIQLITLTLLISTPFGYWRDKTRKYSLAWFLSIHIPIPALYLIRRAMGLSLYYLPLISIFFILGHILGARWHKPPGSR